MGFGGETVGVLLRTTVEGMGVTEGLLGVPRPAIARGTPHGIGKPTSRWPLLTLGRAVPPGGSGSVGCGGEPGGPRYGPDFGRDYGRNSSAIGRHGTPPARQRRVPRGVWMGTPPPGSLCHRSLLPGAPSRGVPGSGFRKGRRGRVCGWRAAPIVGTA